MVFRLASYCGLVGSSMQPLGFRASGWRPLELDVIPSAPRLASRQYDWVIELRM